MSDKDTDWVVIFKRCVIRGVSGFLIAGCLICVCIYFIFLGCVECVYSFAHRAVPMKHTYTLTHTYTGTQNVLNTSDPNMQQK